MITARVYSPTEADPAILASIQYGLDMVAEHTGAISLTGVHKIAVPTDASGYVDVSRVGYGKLDIYTDLHIFAAPTTDSSLGVAYRNRGVAWVNLNGNASRATLHSTTAHEVGHALGFVRQDSPQAIVGNRVHCSCAECIMHPVQEVARHIHESAELRRGLFSGRRTREVTQLVMRQQVFCGDCSKDMRQLTGGNLASMRFERLRTGLVMSADRVKVANNENK